MKTIALLLLFSAGIAGCNKHKEENLMEEFCASLKQGGKNINETILIINRFLSSLPEEWNEDIMLRELLIWLNSCPCINYADYNCLYCSNMDMPTSRISIYPELLDISMTNPMKVIGFLDNVDIFSLIDRFISSVTIALITKENLPEWLVDIIEEHTAASKGDPKHNKIRIYKGEWNNYTFFCINSAYYPRIYKEDGKRARFYIPDGDSFFQTSANWELIYDWGDLEHEYESFNILIPNHIFSEKIINIRQ